MMVYFDGRNPKKREIKFKTMDKAELMALGTIIKLILGLIGIVATMVLLVMGLIKKDNKRLKRAGLIFLGTFLTLIVLGTIEFLFLANY